MKRKALKRESHIFLCSESGDAKTGKEFLILDIIKDSGSSGICYEARNEENRAKGILKEFYPMYPADINLMRDKNGQLIQSDIIDTSKDYFTEAQKRYLEPYHYLQEKRLECENREFAGFIPYFEIYYGCDAECNPVGTVYIWTPEPKKVTFEAICDDIHRSAKKDSEYKLWLALSAIKNLTECIYILHKNGILHRDIKPANFGFIRRGEELLPQTVCIFDIDSICSAAPAPRNETEGTPGFMEPEITNCDYSPNLQTDIYSIGATLFNAIIVPEEDERKDDFQTGKLLSDDGLRAYISKKVASSLLICSSEANSYPPFRKILTQILYKCLCERRNRYKEDELLLQDIEKAMYYALPSRIFQEMQKNDRLTYDEIKKLLTLNVHDDGTAAIQYHLYDHPLYKCEPDSDSTDVMIMGFGKYGTKFLDVCLQAGQMIDRKLCVIVFSKDSETDKALYLEERPELADFFNIDGSLEGNVNNYGTIRFEKIALSANDFSQNTAAAQKIIEDCYENKHPVPEYVFIALGNDDLNLNAAKACAEAFQVLEMNGTVNFVREKDDEPDFSEEGIHPVYVLNDIRKHPLYPEIERMALNVHLVWEDRLNIDFKKIKAAFKERYNHASCVSNVLSLKYKLYSIGIDLDKIGFKAAAEEFERKWNQGAQTKAESVESEEIKNRLVCIEHKRWVTEKLCDGWRRLRDLEKCGCGDIRDGKDEKHKQHVCIVRSEPNRRLSSKGHKFWDSGNLDKAKLDELDRMSVELHRAYKRNAGNVKKEDLLTGSNIKAIRQLISGNHEAELAFQEWFVCLKDICGNNTGKVLLYEGLTAAFKKAAENSMSINHKVYEKLMDAFEARFYPVLQSTRYHEYKSEDVKLIEKIPFILTYSVSACLIIPFTMGANPNRASDRRDNTSIFANVASVTVINPAAIIYLCQIKSKNELNALEATVPYIAEYMQKKQLRAAVDLVITYPAYALELFKDKTEDNFKKISGGRVRHVKKICFTNDNSLYSDLWKYLIRRRGAERIFALEKNNTNFAGQLQGAGFYARMDSYEFDSYNTEFRPITNCSELTYIKSAPYMTVNDMIALVMSSCNSGNQPEFYVDYDKLWGKYSENSMSWKMLCESLGNYHTKNDLLMEFDKNDLRGYPLKPSEPIECILPSICCAAIKKTINALITHGFISEDSCVENYTTDSCKVSIYDFYGYDYNKLFSKPYKLSNADAISIQDYSTQNLSIVYDDLQVFNLIKYDSKNDTGGECRPESSYIDVRDIPLLKFLAKEMKYLINLRGTDDKDKPNARISFTYAAHSIKQLLTTAGRVLEVYTYHKARASGRFDDAVSSCEVYRKDDTKTTNEADCIITQGFRSLIIECKARPVIEQEYYHKLTALASNIGINAIPVLIADTERDKAGESKREALRDINDVKRNYGDMGASRVITVWKKEDIDNIDSTLQRILDGDYVS